MKRVLAVVVLAASTAVALPVFACGSNAPRGSNTLPNGTPGGPIRGGTPGGSSGQINGNGGPGVGVTR